jgi:hypothetical protein
MTALGLAAFLLCPPLLSAYKQHLTEDDVREAFLFGQRHDLRVARFFDAYEKQFVSPGAPGDPRVRAIGVRTPYGSAVLRSYQLANTYSARQDWKDYKARADVFELVIWIDFPVTYILPASANADPTDLLMQMFKVHFKQEREVALRRAFGRFEATSLMGGSIGLSNGLEWHLEYNVQDVESAAASVRVTDQSNRTVTAEFDLAALR